jgi:hypothetical protein
MRNNTKPTSTCDRRLAIVRRLVALALINLALGCGQEPTGPVLAGGRELQSWITDLDHRSPKVRRVAVLKLGNVGDSDPLVPPALARSLNDPDPLVRRDAIMGISKLTNPDQSIRDQLEKMSKLDHDPTVREHAGHAFNRLVPPH